MNTTGKLVFALVLITGLAATGAAIKMTGHSQTTPTIQLDAVVVTPASAPQTIQLAAVRVTPTQADWQYARAHGVSHPVATVASTPETIELAAVTVVPTEADWAFVQAQGIGLPVVTVASAGETTTLPAIHVLPTQADWQFVQARGSSLSLAAVASVEAADHLDEVGTGILTQALNALAPGQFLNTGATLRTLGTLVFGGNGR